jgi:transcription termination factor Rho
MTVTEVPRRRRTRAATAQNNAERQNHTENTGPTTTGIVVFHRGKATLRTRGYLPERDEVRVPQNLQERADLRPGDMVEATVSNGTVTGVQSINGRAVGGRRRPEFDALGATHPAERIRLETDPQLMTTRVIDLAMPLGKGQRALIVAPPKAGKTTVLRDIANAVSRNHPECHLIVLLVDERPEEVTEWRRFFTPPVRAEVVAATFDRSPADHIAVADLTIERAKRLVELGRDVVVIVDSITRLGRAYNNVAPGGGRTLTGGIDSAALQAPKRLLGAARNTESAGSLTVIASALVETGSAGDNVLFEEYKGTGNAELRLDRKIAERRVYPAVDVNASGTRREELLLDPRELAATHALRRALAQVPAPQALDQLLDRLRRTGSNAEFLYRLTAGR